MAINLEKIQKMPTPQKALIVGGVILLIYVGYYAGWLMDKQKQIKKKQVELSDLRDKVAKGEAVKQEIAKFEQIQKDLDAKLKEAEKKLPKEAEIPALLDKMSDLARGNLLVFSTFRPEQKMTPGCGNLCQQIPVNVNLVGSYHQIARFLDQVSKLERIINVDKITFKPKGGPDNLSADVKFVTYMFGG